MERIEERYTLTEGTWELSETRGFAAGTI